MPADKTHYMFEVAVNSPRRHGETAVLFWGEGRPTEGHGIGPTIHDYYLMHTVVSGYGSYTINGKRYLCGAGDTFLIFPGVLFQYAAADREPWHYIWAAFHGHRCETLLQQLGWTPDRPVMHGAGRKTFSLYRKLRRALHRPARAAFADMEAEALLRLLLLEIARADPEAPPAARPEHPPRQVVLQAMRWLELQYSRPISIAELSKSLGYHRTHLSKLFRQSVGLSPMQYLMQLRLERAKTLLDGRWTVEQVASAVGFSDPLHFSKQFRKRYGMSPTAYRKHGGAAGGGSAGQGD